MKEYYKDNDITLYEGKMQDVLGTIPENSIDSIVCDPPYELTSIAKRCSKENAKPIQYGKDGSFRRLTKGFMNQTWDATGVAFDSDAWGRAYKVLKPGGYLLAFGGTRTYHRIACAIEDAGFEIRVCIMWLYGSGFPKSHNVGLDVDKLNGVESKVVGTYDAPDTHDIGIKQKELGNGSVLSFGQIENAERIQYEIKQAQNEWSGYGTALKPAYEPVIVARKPISESSVAQNCLKWGVGGINIDECRVDTDEARTGGRKDGTVVIGNVSFSSKAGTIYTNGRFPANIITDGSEEVAKGMPNTKSTYNIENKHETEIHRENADVLKYGYAERFETGFNDEGSAMRYFYQAKASKKDRDDGLIELESGLLRRMRPDKDDNNPTWLNKEGRFAPVVRKNVHPTVKPVELMQYLVRLVSPKGSTILDCYMGSGSTGKAVMFENRERNANYKFIGIEMTEEYLPIAKARIIYGRDKYEYDGKQENEQQRKENGQVNIFDFLGD